jgi:hypothetical protein
MVTEFVEDAARKLVSSAIDAEIAQVPVPAEIVTRPLEELTEHAVEDPAEYVIAPLLELVARTVCVCPKFLE